MPGPAPGNWVPTSPPGSGFAPGAQKSGPTFVSSVPSGAAFVDPLSIPTYGSARLTYGKVGYTYGSTVLTPSDYPHPTSPFVTTTPSTGAFAPGTQF